MSLDLAPEIENSVRAQAESEGITIDDLLARHFPPQLTQDDPVHRVRRLLSLWRQQDGTPPASITASDSADAGLTPSEALFQKWDAEDALLSEAERQAQRDEWADFQKSINTARAEAGMRPVF